MPGSLHIQLSFALPVNFEHSTILLDLEFHVLLFGIGFELDHSPEHGKKKEKLTN